MLGLDLINQKGADNWPGVGFKRGNPLSGMLAVVPAVPMRPNVGCRARCEIGGTDLFTVPGSEGVNPDRYLLMCL